MRFFVLILAASVLPFAASAQLGATASTNRVYSSEVIEEPAWKRQVVMMTDEGKIFNDSGAVGDGAESAAAGEAAERAAEIGEAARVSMTNSLRALVEAQGNAATNAIALALVVAPETSRTNLTAFVVKTESDGVIDTQWVWFNRKIDLAPNRFVVYQTFDYCSTNKVTWVNWTNAVTVTHNGRTWQGCHVCTVTRPTWAQNETCLDLPNETFGGPDGFDFGDLLLTQRGQPCYTGYVTNNVTGEVLYFDNGFCKGNPRTENTP